MSEIFDRIKKQVNSPAQSYDASMQNEVDVNTIFQRAKQREAIDRWGSEQIPGFEIDKYKDYLGETFNPLSNIDEKRAQSQTTGQLTKGFFGQLASETLFGMGEAVGYVLDFEELANHEQQAQEGFSNWFSDAMRQAKEYTQDLTPVYRTEDAAEGNIFERMTDGSFWASQGKTIGTTLSLLAPSILVGAGVTALAGATGGAGLVAAAPMLGAVGAALFSRKAESAMEAYGTFDQEYNKYLNEGKSDIEARELAGQSASKVFKANAMMLPVDIAQFALGMKAFSGIKGTIDAAKASKLGKVANYAFQPVSEALEEGYQYVAQEEAIKSVREGFDAFGDGLGDRVGEYLREPDMHEAMVLGAVTGVVFDAVMPVGRAVRNKYEDFATNKLITANLGDVDSFNKINNKIERNILQNAAKTGKFEQVAQGIKAVMEDAKTNAKYTPEAAKEMIAKGEEMLSNLEYVKKADETLSALKPEYATNRHAKADYVLTKYNDKKNSEYIGKLDTEIGQLENKMTDPRDRAVILKTKLNSVRFNIKKIESDQSIKPIDKKQSLEKLKDIEESLVEQLDSSLEVLRNTPEYKGFSLDKYTTPDIVLHGIANTKKIMADLQKDILRAKLAKFENMTPEEVVKHDEAIKKDIAKNVKKSQKEQVTTATTTAKTPEEVKEVITQAGDLAKDAKDTSTLQSESEPKVAYGAKAKEDKALLPTYEGSPHTENKDVTDLKGAIDKANLPIIGELAANAMEQLNAANNASEVNVALQLFNDTEVVEAVNDITKEFLNNREATIEVTTVNEPLAADKLSDKEDIQEPSTESRSYAMGNIMEFFISPGGKTDYDKQPWKDESSDYYLEDKPGGTDYNPDIANDLDFEAGTELEFEVYYSDNNKRLAAKDDKNGTFTEVQIVAVRYVKGQRQVITMLSSKRGKMPQVAYDELMKVRQQISLGAKEFYSKPENSNKIYKSGIKAKATPVGGIIRQDGEKQTLQKIKSDSKKKTIVQALKDILPSFKKGKPRFMLGVVRWNRDMGVYVQTPNAPDGMTEVPVKSRPGATMMWIKGVGGKSIPARVYTKNFSKIKAEMPEIYAAEIAEIKRLFTASTERTEVENNLKKISDKYFYATFKAIKDAKTGKVSQITIIKSSIGQKLKEISDIEDTNERNEAYSKFRDNLNLTQAQLELLISGKGSVKGSNIYGAQNLSFTINLNATDETNPNSINSAQFEEFIQDMEHQVNVDLINRESQDRNELSYNEQILQFLETNIPTDRPIHSVMYKLEFVEAKEEKIPDDIKEEVKPVEDIESKKADIERRRNEELDRYDENPDMIYQKINNINIKPSNISKIKVIGKVVNRVVLEGKFDKEGNILTTSNKKHADRIQQAIKIMLNGESATTETKELELTIKSELSLNLEFELGEEIDYEIAYNKINAKYDAELEALQAGEKKETSTTETVNKQDITGEVDTNPKVTDNASIESTTEDAAVQNDIKTLNDIWGISGDKLKEVDGTVESAWNQEVEVARLKEILPLDEQTIRLVILPTLINIGGKQAWGSFKSNLIQMYEGAPRGVLYHEAFHAVFGMALNDTQRSEVLAEAAKKYGTNDVDLLEEMLADEFKDYMLSNGYAYKTLPQKIAQFFKNIYTFIKNKLFNSSAIDALFYNISSGEYKNAEFFTPSNARAKASLAGSNYVEEYARIQAISSYMSKVVDDLAALDTNKNVNRVDVIKKAGSTYIFRTAMNRLFKDLTAKRPDYSSYQMQQAINMMANVSSIEVKDGIPVLPDNYSIRYLGRKAFTEFALIEKVRIDVQGSVSMGIDPSTDPEVLGHDEEIKQIEHWMISITEQSLRDKTKSEVKSILARIPLRNRKGEIIKDDLGFDKYMEFNTAFATMLREVSGATSSQEMMDAIEDLVQDMPEFKDIQQQILDNPSLKTLFWDALQNTHADFRLLTEQKKDNQIIYTWMSSNRQQVTRMVVDEWLIETINPVSNILWEKRIQLGENSKEYLEYKQRAANKLEAWYDKRAYEDDIKGFAKFINSLGIGVSTDELQQLKDTTTSQGSTQLRFFARDLKVVLSTIVEGKVTTKGDLLGDLGDNLKKPARVVGRLRKDLMESSFMNGEKKTIYSHILMGFLPKLISKLTNKSNFNEDGTLADESFVNELSEYVGYQSLPWLSALRNKDVNENFRYSIFDALKELNAVRGTPYTDLSPKLLNKTRLNAYFNNGNKKSASFMVPILSDNPISMFMQHERRTMEQGMEDLYQTLVSEWDIVKNANEFSGIKNFEKKAFKLVMFESIDNSTTREKLEELANAAGTAKYSELKQNFKDTILTPYVEVKYKELLNELKEQKLIKGTGVNITSKDIDPRIYTGDKALYTSLENYLKEYALNNIVAKANMLMLFTGSPAAYKNTSDVYKRLKQVWSAGKRLDVDAKYVLTEQQQLEEGITDPAVEVGENYGVKVLYDVEEFSNIGDDVLKLHLAKGKGEEAYAIAASLGYYDKAHFEKTGEKMAITKDANGDIIMFPTAKSNLTDGQSFISPRRMRQIMIGRGLWNSQMQDEFIKMLQGKNSEFEVNPFKPFVFGFRVINGMRVPYQVKNSETMLTPQMSFVKMADGKITIQLPTSEDRETNYSTYEYPTLAKMLDDMERYSYDDDARYGTIHFNSTIKVGEYNVDTLDNISSTEVQLLNNEDYMVIQEVSDHFTDNVSNFGVQIRKLVVADLEDTKYDTEYFGSITKDKVIDLWHNLIYNDVKTSFDKIQEIFPSKDSSIEDYNAKMVQLSNRLIKEVNERNLGTQALEGVSLQEKPGADGRRRFNIPLFDPLHASRTEALLGSLYRNNVIKQKINGGNLVMASSVGLSDSLEIKRRDDGSIEYFEADMPYWSKELFADYIDAETGYIDMSKVPDELRNVLGYRIPTEDNYSILPIKVRRFLPRTSGGIIILPREITKIMGADFDIDKLYMMFPNFIVRRYDVQKAKRDFNKANEGVKKLTADILNIEEDGVTDNEIFNNWWEDNKESYKLDEPIIKKVKYDTSKSYEENSKEARDNAKMDLAWSVLTNSAMSHKGLNPGNFEYLTELSKAIKAKRGISDDMDILSPVTETKMFEAAVGASALIGVFANQNINHAIFQHGNIGLKEPIVFGNNVYSNLSGLEGIEESDIKGTELENIKEFEPKKTSRKLAMMLSAIVDDLKHLNSGPLNINFFTADIISMMMRMGMNMNTSISLINQPIILQLNRLYREYGSDYNAYNKAYREIYSKLPGSTLGREALTFKNLWNSIGKDSAIDEKGVPLEGINIALQQEALEAFDELYKVQQSLRKAVKAFRSDDVTRKVTLASNEAVERNKEKLMKDDTFIGMKDLWDKYVTLKGFYEYGVEGSTTTLNNFFMYNNPAFKYIKTKFADNLAGTKELSEDNIQHLNFEIMSAALTGYEFFNPKAMVNDTLTNEQYYIQKFPDRYAKFLKEHPELKDMFRLFNNLEHKPKTDTVPVARIIHKNTGTLTERDKSAFSESWIGILSYQDAANPDFAKQVRELGTHLVKYTYFAYGFHMDSNSFSQYIPVTWRNGFNANLEMSYNDFLEKLFVDSKNFSKFAEETGGSVKFKNLYKQIKQNLATNKFFVQRYEPLKKVSEYSEGKIGVKEYLEANGVVTKGNKPVSFTLNADDRAMLVKEVKEFGDTKKALFPDYVTLMVEKQAYIFEQVTDDATRPAQNMNYRVINRLGIPHFHKEYDVNSVDKESIHGFNNIEEAVEVKETPTTQQPAQDVNKIQQEVEKIVTSEGYIKDSAKKHLPKELFKIKQATQFIGTGKGNDSTTQRMEDAYKQVNAANTGRYSVNDLIYVSSNGKRTNRVSPVENGKLEDVYKNIDIAVQAGAKFIMDTKAHLDRTGAYNLGEIALANYLSSKGYIRNDETGVWSKQPTQDKSKFMFEETPTDVGETYKLKDKHEQRRKDCE